MKIENEQKQTNKKAKKKHQLIQGSRPKWQNSNKLTVKDEG